MTMHNHSPCPVGVMGATGYTGLEILRLLRAHPGVAVAFATSEGNPGASSGIPGLALVPGAEAPLDAVDVVFLCLPHGAAADWAPRVAAAGARVVDLTADHRPGSGREAGWVYGMADLHAGAVAAARQVANPGCYPTGVTLALHPLARAGLLRQGEPVVVNAASGVTGAGRTPRRDLLFAEVASDFRAYATGNVHRHLLEMRASLPGVPLVFQPHLLPVARGILETLYLPVAPGVDAAAVASSWARAYADAGGIAVVDSPPALADVAGTDRLLLHASDNAGVAGLVTALVAFDNLGKGAAGQAVQNMNLMLGMPAGTGVRW